MPITAVVYRPFSPLKLAAFKASIHPYRQDPTEVATLMEMVFSTNNLTWMDVQILLNNFVTLEEKSINSAA